MTAITRRPPPAWQVTVAALVERALWTYAQAFALALVGSTFFETLDWSVAASAAVAAIPALLSFLLALAKLLDAPADWPPLAKVAVRTFRTWLVVLLGALAGGAWVLDLHGIKLLVLAAVGSAGAALLAAVKAEVATYFGVRGSTATLPRSLDPSYVDTTAVEKIQ